MTQRRVIDAFFTIAGSLVVLGLFAIGLFFGIVPMGIGFCFYILGAALHKTAYVIYAELDRREAQQPQPNTQEAA